MSNPYGGRFKMSIVYPMEFTNEFDKDLSGISIKLSLKIENTNLNKII